MTEEITRDTFAHLVELAALDLAPEEAEYLRNQLNNQLKSIQELVLIPLPDDVPAASHGITYTSENSQLPRPDVWLPYNNNEGIISQLPDMDDGYVVVPDIPHTTLE
jgi:aspartyl-tRNA(Asn)/glutamyl-tRNA(Gln) amidotransferase subunit C